MVKAMVAMREHKRVMMTMIIVLVLVLLFGSFMRVSTARAAAGALEMEVLDLLYTILVLAGVKFAEDTDLGAVLEQFYTDFFDDAKPERALYRLILNEILEYYQDGLLTITEAVKEGFEYLISDTNEYFNDIGGDYNVYNYTIGQLYGNNNLSYYITNTLTYSMMNLREGDTVTVRNATYVYYFYTTVTPAQVIAGEQTYDKGLWCRRTEIATGAQLTEPVWTVGSTTYTMRWAFAQVTNGTAKYIRAFASHYVTITPAYSTQSGPASITIPLSGLQTTYASTPVPYEMTNEDVIGLMDKAFAEEGALTFDLVNTGVQADVRAGSPAITTTQEGVLAGAGVGAETGNPGNPELPGDLTDYEMPDLRDKFPFCIPFDFINLVKAFNQPSVTPNYSFDIEIPFLHVSQSVDLDFSDEMWGPCVQIVRWGVLVSYTLGLILITRKIIGG